jgi:Protein of unknown function (DUF1631)
VATSGSTGSLANAALARQARELYLAKAVEILTDVAHTARTRLNALVDQSANARESQDRRDAWIAYQKSESVWVNSTTSAWKKAMLPPTSSLRTTSGSLSFELMGNDIVENKILSSRLALRILDKATWELNDLTLRVRQLENVTEFDKQDLLRPESCAQLVVESWLGAGLTREAWMSVQEVVHNTFGTRMVEAYHTANAFLIEKGVMQEIDLRPLVKRTPSALPSNSSAAPLAPADNPSTQQQPMGRGDMPSGAELKRSPTGGSAGANQSGGAAQSGYGGTGGGGGHAGGSGGYGGGGSGGGAPVSSGGLVRAPGASARAGAPSGYSGPTGGGGSGGGSGGQAGQSGGQSGGQMAAGGGAPPMRRQAPSAAAGGSPGASLQGGQGGGQAQNAGQAPQRAGRAAVAQYAEESHDETRMMTSSTPLARAKMRAQGVMGQLKRMLTDKVMGFDDSRSYTPSPQLAAAMAPRRAAPQGGGNSNNPAYARTVQGGPSGMGGGAYAGAAGGVAFAGFVEGMRPEEAAGALREETSALKKAASTESEKATIEIVALMFQSILAEDRIPPTVRVWFARLQMPVLRLALSEPEFFGSLQHPARRLIDRMGSCVLGFEADVSSTALETEIKRVVQVIEQYPETGRRVFQLVYDEFQKFLSKFLTEGTVTQRVVSVAQQMEQKETAAIQFTIELRKLLGDVLLRDEIREFLFKVWAEVMAISSIKNGPKHADALGLKQVAADLVWAASAKPNRADRAKVIQDLPNLLKRLRAGMALLGFDQPKQDEHIKAISDTLADAFMSKTETIDPAQIEAMAKRLKNLEDFVSEDDVGDLPLDAESIELMLGIDTSGIDIITSGGSDPTEAMRAWAMELEEGSWFNLDHNSKVTRVQYAWRSQRGQLHLFAGTNGRTYLFQIRRLAAYMQAGLVSPIEDETLTVRATRNALDKLNANPERLLS